MYSKTLSVLFSIACLTLVQQSLAGKNLLENAENDYAPVYTVKPYTFSSSKEVNSLHFFESGCQ